MLFERLIWSIRVKLCQIRFCEQYLQKHNSSPRYRYYLKHISKEERVRNEFISLSIYDVLDNNGFNKLIRRIYRLKRNKRVTVETNYIYHKFLKKNYINSNLAGWTVGRVATVTPKDDKWIKAIEISFTYINNSQAIIQYEFVFRKVMNTPLKMHDFVVDNIAYVTKKDYFFAYYDRSTMKNADCRELYRLDYILFVDVIQAYICSLFYTQYGKEYQLPIEYEYRIIKHNKKKAKQLRRPFLSACYEKENDFLIISQHFSKRFEMSRYCSSRYLPGAKMLRYFTLFPTEMYYTAFYSIELNELEKKMRKYLNSNRSFVFSWDVKWLINKSRYISEFENRMKTIVEDDNIEKTNILGWKCYVRGKELDRDFLRYPEQTSFFKSLYEENLSYLNSLSYVQNNKIVIFVGVITFLATLIGIII